MRSLLIFLALFIASSIVLGESPVRATTATIRFDPAGEWWAEGGAARVRIDDCDEGLCGRVIWLRHPLGENGCELADIENPDPALRDRPVEGLQIMGGLAADSTASVPTWRDGWIYDPGGGRTYRATLRMRGPDRLELRGYVGFELLGRTATWIRVGSEGQCGS